MELNIKKGKIALKMVKLSSELNLPDDKLDLYLQILIKFYLTNYENNKNKFIEVVSEMYDSLEEIGKNHGFI